MKIISGTVIYIYGRFCCRGIWDHSFEMSVPGKKRPVVIWVRKPFDPLDPPQRLVRVRLDQTIKVKATRIKGVNAYKVLHDADFLEWDGRVWDGNQYVDAKDAQRHEENR